ncbi:N-glycosylase [Thermogymnomonas acidicola]|uniref:8-oxoguanine DNA glycosylase/AP lyase n=1 Tax=Thermogymnomonas acidicola TaxID=399579 RepID=A0AA37BQB5_9ARCH|nr:N-glycosylase [Thermogymnomonas acidicola]
MERLREQVLSGSTSVIDAVSALMDTPVRSEVESRAEEFRVLRSSDPLTLFGELCFCIITANTSAELGLRMQRLVPKEFFAFSSYDALVSRMHSHHCRFYRTRSQYIYRARWVLPLLPAIVNERDRFYAREFMVANVDGLGYKEASHFLRNVGVFDFAILDKHVLRLVSREIDVSAFRAGSAKSYLAVERELAGMASQIGLEPGIFDLYLWKIATGRVLK